MREVLLHVRRRLERMWRYHRIRVYFAEASWVAVEYPRYGVVPTWGGAGRLGFDRFGRPDHEAALEDVWMSRNKGEGRRVVAGDSVPTDGPTAVKMLGNLIWHLTATKYADGSPRRPGSLLVFAQDGVYKLMIRDRDEGLCLWLATQTIEGVLMAAEAGLGSPAAEWRVDRQQEGQQASRVKKK